MLILKKFLLIFFVDLFISYIWFNYLGEIILFLASSIFGVLLDIGLNLFLLLLINNLLINKVFKAKNKSLYHLKFPFIPIIACLLLIIAPYSSSTIKNILGAEYLIYRANNVNLSSMTETYINNSFGFSFKYPNQTNVIYKENLNEIEISSIKNSWANCEIRINPISEQLNNNFQNIKLNGYEWSKWYTDEPGFWGRINKVVWDRKWRIYEIKISTYKEVQNYCEKIISTFNFR